VITIPVSGRHNLTDTQWAMLAPLLPTGTKPGRPPKWTKRQLIDGIRWRTRVGAPWRDVLACYGRWQTVHGLFRRWQRDGTWARILTGLQARADAAGLIRWDVSVDTTIARAVLDRIRIPRMGPGRPRHPAGPSAGRQGLQLKAQPGLPAPTQDPVHDPGQGRSGC
jgi:transposase